MHSTHDINCKGCGTELAFWSGFGDNMQFKDEYQCLGKVRIKREHWHYGKTETNKKPTLQAIKQEQKRIREYGISKPIKVIYHKTEMQSCYLINYTYFCEGCARKLRYKCPICGGKIKLTRKR